MAPTVWRSSPCFHSNFWERRRKRFVRWLAVIALALVYFHSLRGMFRLESEFQSSIRLQHSSTTSSSSHHTLPGQTTTRIPSNQVEHFKRLSDFMRPQQQDPPPPQQQQHETQKRSIPTKDQPTKFLEIPQAKGISGNFHHQVRGNNNTNDPVNNTNAKERTNASVLIRQAQGNKSDNHTGLVVDRAHRPRVKLQFKLAQIGLETQQPYGSTTVKNANKQQQYPPLWELSDFLPLWMKEYFAWHQETRQTLTEELLHRWKTNHNNNSTTTNILHDDVDDGTANLPKLLVLQCMPQPERSSTNESASSATRGAFSSSCGNLAERLTGLPYWVRMAHETNRLLFIHWTIPTDLSQYLEPPVGGCDWRPPRWLKELLDDNQQGTIVNDKSKVLSDSTYLQSFDSKSLLRVQLKHSLDFEDKYNSLRKKTPSISGVMTSSFLGDSMITEEPEFHEIFHDIWILFFVPTDHIRKNIYNTFRENLGMEPAHYVSIDLSSSSPSQHLHDDGEAALISKAKRIFECASRLRQKKRVMVITDVINVTLALEDDEGPVEHKGRQASVPVFARYKTLSKWSQKHNIQDRKELLPQNLIDMDSPSVPTPTPESFHDIFVSLYLMSMGGCIISYRPGIINGNDITLSHLGSLIGFDSKCNYQIGDNNLDALLTGGGKSDFVDSNCEIPSDSVTVQKLHGKRGTPTIKTYFSSPMIPDGIDSLLPRKQMKGESGANASKMNFPQWMEEYLAWHRTTKSQLTRSNWKDSNYLILGCFGGHKNCGGISDRLKPLPMLVWEAHQSQRILLIWWERPKPLEEWLIPPNQSDGGVDWTVPLFLKEEILKAQPRLLTGKDGYTAFNFAQGKALRKGAVGKNAIVYRIQSTDAGESLYVEEQLLYANSSSQTNSDSNIHSGNKPLAASNSLSTVSSYQDVYHHLFRRFFTPNPRLAGLINSKMKQHNLVPGEYTAVHLRALFGNRNDRDPHELLELAVLGVNCASNLFPGVPVVFASDSSFAVDSAHAYGILHNLPIVSLDLEQGVPGASNATTTSRGSNPIHLDKDPDWKNRSASAYDSTFVDLYMLAQSRCVAFSNGGYGTFGSLLSYDSECKMRFFQGRNKASKCSWVNETFRRQKLELPNVTDVIVGGRVGNVALAH